MSFAVPELLWAAPLGAAAVWVIAYRGRWTLGKGRRRWVLAMRLIGITLALLALSQPVLNLPQHQKAVLFVLDRSLSVDEESRAEQERLVAQALESAGEDDLAGMMVFGAGARMDASLTTGREILPVRSVVDSSATELAGALRASGALLPTAGSRRVILMSDMADTGGEVITAAEELAREGVTVDVVVLETSMGADVLVDAVELPGLVREGDMVGATVIIRSDRAGSAQLRISAGDYEEWREIELRPGVNRIEVAAPIEVSASTPGGPLAVEAHVLADWDPRPENNRAVGITRVEGPARIAVVENPTRRGEGAQLQTALRAFGFNTRRVVGIPTTEALAEYDGVVLVNAEISTTEEAERLAAYVEDFGRGLVVVGGDRSFGMGDYHLTPLEAVLPVSSDPDNLLRRQPVAEVLALDTSGSMGSCHCGGNAARIEGGVPKTAIAQAGASQAIEALTSADQVGVLAFSSGFDWTIPLGPRPDPDTTAAALSSITPEGATEIRPALSEALRVLSGVEGSLRHIVLFTDGWDPNEAGLLPLARQIADEGVTLSVLGTGEGPGATLERMAQLGGGRYYPGADLDLVPEIFVEETLLVADNLVREGVFYPVRDTPTPVIEDLVSAPPLRGYVATKAKGTATVSLEVGASHPLLASWQRGLGRVTVWTSDATSRWSAEWVEWPGYASFWGKVVRDTLSPPAEEEVSVAVREGELDIRVERPNLPTGASGIARVRGPDGEVWSVALRRVSAEALEGNSPAPQAGAYWVTTVVTTADIGSTVSSAGAVSTYQEEFSFLPADPTLAVEVSEATGGRVNPSPEAMFDVSAVRGIAELSIWPVLVGAALVLFLVDAAARRLRWSVGKASSVQTVGRRPVGESYLVEDPPERSGAHEPPAPVRSETLERLMRRAGR